MKTKLSYEDFKELCKKEGTWCPEEHLIHKEVANTDVWLRLWFKYNY